ncbi:uncharacterized protein LOC141657001 [Silene latifolia]|uniref:uncharacterized protein LOC141657001 n=1 Tax=Silene latifolia TaxID=37657 RepID=UPI003D7776EE
MEVGKGGGGPTTSNNRPIRASARFFSYGPNSSSSVNFSGPVRKWHKMWVPVSVPDSVSKKNTRGSKPQLNNNKSTNSSILLCKWTPLAAAVDGGGDGSGDGGGFVSRRRKFRYTPIAVTKDQKKVTAKRVADQDSADKIHLSQERPTMDSDDSYGMLDINNDLNESPPESSKSRPISQYSRRN